MEHSYFASNCNVLYVLMELLYYADEVNGRMDFNNTVQELVLSAGLTSDDYIVSIPITRDSFNEASEGFMIVMRPDESRSNPADVANIVYQNGGVALGVIDDDDRELPTNYYKV